MPPSGMTEYRIGPGATTQPQYTQDERDFIDRALIAAMQGLISFNYSDMDGNISEASKYALSLLTQRRSILGKKEVGDD